ncbi:MAG: hypothetical protein WCO69_03775 [Candidatus Omnitrophota bacterium]
MASLKSSNITLNTAPEGGRISSLFVFGHELLWQGDGEPLPTVKDKSRFYLSGGDRTWVSPENEWVGKTPPLDLDSGLYSEQEIDGGIILKSPCCRETGLQVIRTISLTPDDRVHLKEEIVNVSNKPTRRGVWNVSRVRRPFTVFCPGSSQQWRSYHEKDPTLPVPSLKPIPLGGAAGIPCIHRACYKFGGVPDSGSCAVITEHVVWERHFDIYPREAYAHGAAVEVFNSLLHDYGEVEVHSPLHVLLPGERAALAQIWEFRRKV